MRSARRIGSCDPPHSAFPFRPAALESHARWSLLCAMQTVALKSETDWDGWRQAARALVLAGVEPAALTWAVGGTMNDLPEATGTFHLPRALVTLASVAIQARESDRFGLLYSLVWRAHAGENRLNSAPDPDLALARRMALAVRAEAHRMRTMPRSLPVDDGRR